MFLRENVCCRVAAFLVCSWIFDTKLYLPKIEAHRRTIYRRNETIESFSETILTNDLLVLV